MPDDLAERGRQYDAQRLGGVAVELKSHLPIERQDRVIGATWLDQQLIGGSRGLGDVGFGGDARQQRADFLEEQGLAQRRGLRVILARGRYAMLDDGMGFSLMPCRSVIEQRLGKQIASTVRGSLDGNEASRRANRFVTRGRVVPARYPCVAVAA